ncbi:DUF1983 domain-containing protein [Raoultella ornithinolytica]|uniref:TipJ family phage tail tip protein n=1 Tax=Raoultella ornithinolytica TaxID=54291 RepID=UPI0010BEA4F8|nr:DUF1983 domain-containing protein [Raoultella ornithinolytica]QCK76475.1 DUF1983 domain-containing protein [Raoultella ornithinolytica]
MANNIIKGRKGGSSKQRTPTEQPDDLQSVAKAKILIALGEGEFAGGLTGKDIYLDGTPLENADGSQNFSGVAWEFRHGTQAQSYIQGIPGTENEISVGTEVSSQTAWTHTFTNTQLSAVRVRLKWPSLMKQEDDGDVVGNTVKYAIDLQTDGGAWQTVLETAVSGKTTSGYERSHRIDLPQAGSTWTLRLRKVSPDANSVKIGDVMTLQSYTEVIDAKLRYPHTALLYIEFDSSQFNGSIPQISCEPRGRVIRVPDNYNPETREYTGTWTGGFKWAWTDNPAWIYYDIVVSDRFGLGDRLTSANISKWTLYQIAQYCDQLVPDGRGGDGMEPRYTCNVYVQERNDAYTVLRDFAAIFRGMTCWNGEQIVVQADMPRDVDFTYTRANIVGKPRYSSSSSQVRYTNALVSWSDPDNAYADAMEPAFIPELVSRYSFNQLELTAIGCTRQSEAHRKGLWGILTNNKDRVVEFDVGLDGRIPQPGYIIALADELLAGRVNGGRISAVNGRVITLDRDVDAKPGDRLQLNLPSGISQSRTIQAVNGRRQITVTTAYSETPERECVWAVESNDLFLQQYRVTGVKENGDATLTITGVSHDPDKFARIDTGAIIDQRPVSVLPAGNQSPPDDIVITSRSVVNQGISVETMQVNWSAVSGAIAYEAQWRRNDGNWINVPRSSTTSFEVSGIYAGRYLVRVRAINAAEISSGWAYSEEKTLTGKVGEPLAPLALATRSLVHGVQVSWEFPTGSGDTLRTELQYSKNQDGSAPMPLSDVAYPGKSYQQMGLSMGAEFWYRARLVDRLGNESPWTGWVQGMASDNFDDYYENLTDAIKDTAAWEETQRTISETQEGIRNTQQELEQTAEALRKEAEDQAKQVSQDIDASAKSITADVDGKISAVNKTITDEITSVNEALDSGLAQANKGVQEAKSAVADANKQIATMNKSLTDSITQVRQSVTDTAAGINATIDLEIARVSKTLADGDAALNAQIKTAENGLKQSLSQVNTSLTNAVKQETADRIADVNAKAAQAADELLAATQGIEASIESLTQVMKSADENLAREMSSLAAGANIQFDSQVIWHFNNQTTEGWTGSAGVPGVSQDGWLRPADSATDPYITSPGGLAVDGAAYRFIMLRFRKTGKPVWAGEIRWVSAGENFNNTKRYIVAEPEYADGVATLTVRDIPWTGNIDRIRLDLTNQQDASNFIEFDWIAVGRPAPGASTAALQDVRSTLSNALTAEAQARSTLAAQMRGSYDGSDLEKVTSGLLYQEKTARVTAISAEVKARESLQTQFNDNKAAVSGELSSLTTEQSAQASRIGGLETSLGKKADASALQSLTQKVELQGTTLTSQGNALTSLTNRVGKAESGVAANSNAITGLQSTVSQQGDAIASQGTAITGLTNSLTVTNGKLNDMQADANANIAGNQIKNASFERGIADWTTVSGPYEIITQNSLNFGSKILKTTVGTASLAQETDLIGGRTYRFGIYCRRNPSTVIANQDNNKISIGDVSGALLNELPITASISMGSAWTHLYKEWTPSKNMHVTVAINSSLSAGAQYFDDLYVLDVTVEAKTIANATAITGLTSRVSAAEGAITSQSTQMTQLTNSLNATNIEVGKKANQTDLNALSQTVSTKADSSALQTLDSKVTQQGDAIASQGQSITQINNSLNTKASTSDLDALKSVVNTKADSSALQSLQSTVNQQGNTITSQGTAITGLTNSLNATNIEVGKKANQTDLNALSQTVSTKADSSALQTLDSKVTQQGDAIASQGQSITQINNSLNTKASTSDLDALKSVVNTKADSSALQSLQSTVNQQGDTITSQGTAITSLGNSLTVTNGKLNDMQADANANIAGNQIKNASFERGIADWTTVSGPYEIITQNSLNFGSKILKTTVGTASLAQETDLIGGRTYRFGIYCRRTPSTVIANQDNNKISIGDVSGALLNELPITASISMGSAWTHLYKEWTPSKNMHVTVAINSSLSAGAQYFDDLYVLDVTAETKTIANATAITGLTSRVSAAEGAITSQSTQMTQLTNSLNATNIEVGKKANQTDLNALSQTVSTKADSSALQTLDSKVTQQGDAIASQGQSITQINNSLNTKASTSDLDALKSVVNTKADSSALQSLQSTVNQQGNTITSQGTAITGLTNSMNATNIEVGKKANQTDLNALSQTVSTKADSSALQTLDSKVTQQGDAIASQGQSITQINNSLNTKASTSDLDALKSVVNTKADSSALQSLQSTVNQQGNTITSQGTAITGLTNSMNATNIEVGKKANQTDLNALSQTVSTKADSSALQTLDSKVTQQGDAIASQGQSITQINNSLNTKASTSDLDALKSVVNTKADSSALQSLQSTVNQQGDTITSQGTAITSLGNSLTVTNGKLNDMQADANANIAGNQIKNASFERGIADWTTVSGPYEIITQNSLNFGSKILKTTVGTASLAQETDLIGGRTYRFGIYCRRTPSTVIANQDNNKISIGDVSGALLNELPITASISMGSAWTHLYKEWTPSKNMHVTVAINSSLSAGAQYFDDLYVLDVTAETKTIANATAITGLTSRVSAAEGAITSQSTQMTQLTNSLNATNIEVGKKANQTDLNALSQTVSTKADSSALQTLDSKVTQQGDAIASQGQSITQINNSLNTKASTSDLDALKSVVNTKADSSALQSLQSTVNQQGNTITSQGTAITGLTNSLNATNIEVGKKANQTDLNALSQTVSTKADSSALQTLDSKVTQQGDAIASQGQSITQINNSLNTKASTSDLDALKSVVNTKADSSALQSLQSTVNQQGDTITSQGTAITSLGNSLTVTNGKLNDMQADANANIAGNQIKNASFERGIADWTTVSGPYEIITQNSLNFGSKILKTTVGTASLAQETDLIGGRTYRFGIYCRRTPSTVIANQDNNKISIGDVSGALLNELPITASISMGSAWTHLYKEWTPSKNMHVTVAINSSLSAGAQYFDDLYVLDVTAETKTIANATAITGLTSRVSAAEGAITSQSTQMTQLTNSLNATNIEVGKKANQTDLNALSQTVSTKADSSALQTLDSKVTQQGDAIASQGQSITQINNSLNTKASTSDLDALKSVVNTKADSSALQSLQSTVNQQGDTITSQGTAITSLGNSLTVTNGKLNDMQADANANIAGNQIKNASFERGIADWTTVSGPYEIITQNSLNFGSKILKTTVGTASLAQETDLIGGRTYRFGIYCRRTPSTVIANQDNNKISIGDVSGALLNELPITASISMGSAWTHLYKEWTPSKNMHVTVAINSSLSAGAQYFDDLYVLDVTAETKTIANATAITGLTSRVSAAEGAITSQSTQMTQLTNSLNATNIEVGKKANQTDLNALSQTVSTKADSSALQTLDSKVTQQGDAIASQGQSITQINNSLNTKASTSDLDALKSVVNTKADSSALQSLQSTVTQQGKDLSSASGSVTDLKSSLNTLKVQSNPWIDGTFETYDNNQQLGGSTAVVTTDFKSTGSKCLKVIRPANTGGDADKTIGSYSAVRQSAKYRVEFWAMMPADQAPSSGWTTLVGIQSQNAAGQNAWQAAVTVSEASLGARDKWVKFTGIASNNGAGRTRAVVWISTRGATGNGTPGYSLYIDDLVITDVTDAKAAQDASDATASAVSGLTARVTDAEGKITAQAQQQTALASKVDNANSRVDNMAKTLSDSQSTQASLNTSLQSQIDAQAAANIKNQTTLDNAIKSVASITSTQHTHATALEALATQQTTLTSSVGDLSASVQNTAKTVADVNGTVSSLWSMKVETVNGKNVGAGITLGSNGETSDMILYADRFSLFNRNNATAVPVMIAEGNELYIDTARIKNSSLTSTKIADGSITNAKIGNEIRSNDFVDGSRGWRIAKDGSSQFNNVIVRGRVEATSGVFRGTVQADAFIGDIAVAKSYDSLTFRRNQTVQRNGAYQNRGYSMTVVLACTLVCQTYGTDNSRLGYTTDITFNIGGQEVTRRIFVDAGNITLGTTAFELRFTARLDADYNNVGFFIKAKGRTAAIDYTCTVENITATAFRTDSSSFS